MLQLSLELLYQSAVLLICLILAVEYYILYSHKKRIEELEQVEKDRKQLEKRVIESEGENYIE